MRLLPKGIMNRFYRRCSPFLEGCLKTPRAVLCGP